MTERDAYVERRQATEEGSEYMVGTLEGTCSLVTEGPAAEGYRRADQPDPPGRPSVAERGSLVTRPDDVEGRQRLHRSIPPPQQIRARLHQRRRSHRRQAASRRRRCRAVPSPAHSLVELACGQRTVLVEVSCDPPLGQSGHTLPGVTHRYRLWLRFSTGFRTVPRAAPFLALCETNDGAAQRSP